LAFGETIRGENVLSHRPVIVLQLPEQLDSVGARAFIEELNPLLDFPGPRLVFECSQIRYLDGAGIEMMLHCLEAAIGCDGHLKLAGVSPEAEIVLQLLQKAGVFQEFASCDEAVRSFAAVSSKGISKSAPASVNIFGDPGSLKKAS
jgi:anti-anti-sigma factor